MATMVEAGRDGGLSIGRVFELAVSTIRHNPSVTLVLAFLFGTIPGLVLAYASTQFEADMTNAPLGAAFWTGFGLMMLFSSILGMVVTALTQAVLTRTVVAQSEGRRADLGESIRAAVAVLLPLIGLAILYSLGVALGFMLLIVPGIMLMVAWIVAAPALVEERQGVFEAFQRSRDLTRGARWKIFGTLLVLGALYILVTMGGEAAAGVSDDSDPMAAFRSPTYLLASTITSTLLNVFWGTVQAAFYVELRDWKEGPASQQLEQIFA